MNSKSRPLTAAAISTPTPCTSTHAGAIRFMGPAQSDIEVAALAWWESKRPIGMTERGHLGNIKTNCTTAQEILLSQTVADRVREFTL